MIVRLWCYLLLGENIIFHKVFLAKTDGAGSLTKFIAHKNYQPARIVCSTASAENLLCWPSNGALVLANAGILDGRRCTHTATPKYAPLPEFQELIDFATPRFAKSIYVDEDVVVKEKIITAKPWSHALFAARMAEAGGD
jgi:hypothetical protein